MSKKYPSYAAEYRQQMVELVRGGRTPGELAREFECSASAIRNWVRQADRDEGFREDGLTTTEREELPGMGAPDRLRGLRRAAAHRPACCARYQRAVTVNAIPCSGGVSSLALSRRRAWSDSSSDPGPDPARVRRQPRL